MVTVPMVRGKAGAWGAALCATFALLGLAPAAPATEMAVQPDGKILLAGTTPLYSGYVARLLPSGAPDPSFGSGGVVVDPWSGRAVDLGLQPDGGILVLTEHGTIARYRPDGELDMSFGTGDFSPLIPIDEAAKMLVLPDGRIVVGGTGAVKFFSEALVAILSPDGRSREWISGAGTGTSLQGLLRHDDGSLLATLGSSALARFVPGIGDYGDDFRHVLDVPDARPGYDKSYGGGAGPVRLRLPGEPWPRLQIGGLAANGEGAVAVGASEGRLVAIGLDAEGLLDQSFGNGGFAYFAGGKGKAGGIRDAETVDGKILVAGNLGRHQGLKRCRPCGTPLLARLLPTGRPDPSFGRRGISRLPRLDGQRQNARGDEVALLPDRKILLVGEIGDSTGETVLGRFDPDGTPDRRFGSGGVVRFDPCQGTERRQRRVGCLPSARAELRLRSTPGGAALRFEVESESEWAKIGAFAVHLPRGIEVREGEASRARFSFRAVDGKPRRTRAELRGRSLGFAHSLGSGTDRMVLDVPRGVLRWGPQGVPRAFRVTVEFRVDDLDGGEQTLVARRPG
jgi:uncharacterized delta-60 repeat protein